MTADAAPRPYWLDRPDAPPPRAPLDGAPEADVVVVGGGLTGLWTALQAAEEGKRVVLIECDWEETGLIDVATEPHQLPWLEEAADQLRRFGWDAELLDAAAIRAQVDSPTYLGALWTRDAGALVDTARLCWGLASAAEAAGYVVGFTGLGVGASRFGARVALDLLDGLDTARGSRWSGGGRFRSRRSRRAGRRSGSRSARSRAPTSAPGGAGRGCGRSTGSAWDSTRE